MVAPARDTALDVLLAVEERDAYANLALDGALTRYPLNARDAAFATELTYGTLRAQATLDWVIGQYSSRQLEELSPVVRNALRLAAHQLLYLNVPDHAAVHEAVNQVRTRLHEGAAAYTNAVLRALAEGKEGISWPSRDEDLVCYLSLTLWHPRWLVMKWLEELGPEQTEALCRADNQSPEVTLRVNTTKISRDGVLDRLRGRDLDAHPGTLMAESVGVRRAGALADLPEHAEGLVYAQDEASMAVAHILDPQPGELVVDLCAAPGGKATHLAELMQDRGRIVAVDVNERRLGLVTEASRRLGHDIVETFVADATDWRPRVPADRVLLDAPCSGLGVLARRAEARWRKKPEDIKELARLQARLLDGAAQITRPGGVLVYSTCTISRQENQEQIETFLDRRGEFSPVEIDPQCWGNATSGPGWVQFLPHMQGTDGIFVAKLLKGE